MKRIAFSAKEMVLACVMAALAMEVGAADRLSPLADAPNWSELDAFQETITHDKFLTLLTKVYARGVEYRPFITVLEDRARIQMESGNSAKIYELRFHRGVEKKLTRYWRSAAQMPSAPPGRALAGVKVALDPGHIGGEYAQMEERWFQIGKGAPVMEGDMVLVVARHLAQQLRAAGAEVLWVRDSSKPVTRARPRQLRRQAEQLLKRSPGPVHESYTDRRDPRKQRSIQYQSELLFYRASEIRARGVRVNDKLQPDVTVCLHFNAEPWGDPELPQLTSINHLHLLVNGAYSRGELSLDDVRFEMLMKLLNQVWSEELAISETVAASMAQATGLPPYVYSGDNAFNAGSSLYVWGRNLLANRLYRNPVVYLEPYVMNSHDVYERVQAGDYEGQRMVAGRLQESIYREYARGVAQGLVSYYQTRRGRR